MDLNVSDLAARGLDLAWDGPGGAERRVTLAPSEGVTGLYSITPERHRLDARTDRELVFAGISWPLTEGAVTIEGEAPASRLVVDLVIPRGGSGGTKGQVGMGALVVPELQVRLPTFGPQPLRLAGLVLHDAAMAFDGEGGMAVVAESAEVDRVSLSVGGTEVAAEGLALEGIKLRRVDGGWILHVATGVAQWARVEFGAISLRLGELSLRRLSYRDSAITLGNLGAAQVDLRHPEIGRRGEGTDPAPVDEGPEAARPVLDLAALDRLNGKVDVDVTADTTAPIIGRRRATHHFRLRVDHGAINFYRLEKSLSKLEDALLDFRVKGRQLMLVVDVPFMSLAKKTLVSWSLDDAEELALAERHLVRLRRLMDYRVPRRSPEAPATREGEPKNGKKSFEVRELRFDGIDVELRWSGGDRVVLPSGGAIVLGAPNRPAVGDLSVQGALRYVPLQAPEGGLELVAEKLRLAVEDLALGTRRLDIGRIRSESLKARVPFAGVAPQSAEVEVTALRLRDLALRSAAGPAQEPG